MLAVVASTAVKTVDPIDIQQGFIDTSGYGGGHNDLLDVFDIDDEHLRVRDEDLFGEPGYRFWIPVQQGRPMFAIEQTSATAWFTNSSEPLNAMDIYRALGRNIVTTSARLLMASAGVDL